MRARLAGPLPGGGAQRLMAPRPRPGWDPEKGGSEGRPAAVLISVYKFDQGGRAGLLFTERTEDVETHRGQVSFPGGVREAGETPEQTALRETHEELGISPEIPQLLGRLSPLWIPATGYTVTPIVGILDQRPDIVPNPREVARVLEVPIDELLAPGAVRQKARTADGRWCEIPYFPLDDSWLWGATAMMTAEFLTLLGWPGPDAL